MSSQNSNFSESSVTSDNLILYCRTVDGFFDENIGYHWEQKNWLDELEKRIMREDHDPMKIYFLGRLAKMLKQGHEAHLARVAQIEGIKLKQELCGTTAPEN